MLDPAVFPYHQRLSQNPDDAEALFVLWQWYGDRGEFQQLAALVEQTAARRHDPASAADLYYRAGELWAKNVGRADKAVSSYRRAFELDPSQAAAAEAARTIYAQLGNHKQALQIVERQLGHTAAAAERLPLLRELGSLRAQMGDPSGQAAALEEVIRLVPEDYAAMRELAAAYLARAEMPDAGGPENAMRAAALLVTIAQGLGGEHEVAFAEAALDAWGGDETAYAIVSEAYRASGRDGELVLRQINFLTANPASPQANVLRRELADAYAQAGQYDDAARALEPLLESDPEAARALAEVYRRAGRNAERAALLLTLPGSADPKKRVGELRELAELFEAEGDAAQALAALRGVLEIDPADPEALAAVEDALRAGGAYDELRQVLHAAARVTGTPLEARKARLRQVALLSEQKLHDPAGATEAWRALLAIDPTDAEANSSLEKQLTRAERWDDLARLLEKRGASVTDRAERRALAERLAELHKVRRKDPAAEAEVLQTLWLDAPDDDALALRLVDAHRRAGAQGAVAEVLRQRAESAPEDRAAARWAELAQHHEAQRERDDALRAWQQVATLDPASVTAWDSVEKLLELTGRLDLLLETLIAHAAGPAAESREAALHARAADVARVLGDLPTAQREAEQALALNPDDDGPAGLLAELYEAFEDPRLPGFLRERAERLADGEPRVAALRRLAEYVARTEPAGALDAWEQVRAAAQRAGRSDDVPALEALVSLAHAAGEHPRVASLLEAAGRASDSEAASAEFYARAATVHEHTLGAPDEALRLLLAARAEGASEAQRLERVAALAEQLRKHAVAADALEALLAHEAARAERATDDEAEALATRRARLAARLAALCEGPLGDVRRALAALEQQYDADPADEELVRRMVRLYESADDWSSVLKYLVVLSEVAEGDELADLSRRIAYVAEHKLGDASRAFDALAGAAREGDDAALAALRGLSTRARLERPLAALLEELAADEKLGGTRRAARYRELSELREGALEDRSGALEAMLDAVRAAGESATDNDLGRAERLAVALEEPRRAAEAYEALLAAAEEPARREEVAARAARFLSEHGAAEAGVELLSATLARMPKSDALLAALEQSAAQVRRGDELYMALDRRRGAARDEAERLEWTLRAARDAAVLLGDRATALSYLSQAVSGATARGLDEGRLATIEAAAQALAAEAPALTLREGLVEAYASVVDELGEEEPRTAAALCRRAAVLLEDSGDRARGYELLTRASALWPGDAAALDMLERVAKELRRGAELVGLLEKLADDAYEAGSSKALRARRAALLETLGRVDAAVEAWQGLVETSGKDPAPLDALLALLRRAKRPKDLLVALERALELRTGDERVALLREVAAVWEGPLRNAFEAKDAWRRVLKAAPNDAAAREALERLEKKRGAAVEAEEADELLDAEPLDAAAEAEPLATAERTGGPVEPLAPAPTAPVAERAPSRPTGRTKEPSTEELSAEALTDEPTGEVALPPPLGVPLLPRLGGSASSEEFAAEATGVLEVSELLDADAGATGEHRAPDPNEIEPLPDDDPLAEGLARGAMDSMRPPANYVSPGEFESEPTRIDDGATRELSLADALPAEPDALDVEPEPLEDERPTGEHALDAGALEAEPEPLEAEPEPLEPEAEPLEPEPAYAQAADADADALEAEPEPLEPEPLEPDAEALEAEPAEPEALEAEELEPAAPPSSPSANAPSARAGRSYEVLDALEALEQSAEHAAPPPSPARSSKPPALAAAEDDTPSLDDLARMVTAPKRPARGAPLPPPPGRKS